MTTIENREIDFRAEYKGKIYEIENIYFQDEYISLIVGEFNQGNTIKVKISEVKLLQYTGLKDKNGVKIYVGDIVKSIEERGDDIGNYTEELKEEVLFGGGAFYPVCTAPSENWEVIGNINENKKLLNI